MNWSPTIKGFKAYLQLEKSLAKNSVEAYIADVEKLFQYLEMNQVHLSPEKVTQEHIISFLKWVSEIGLNARSQSRIISGIKAFYNYLLLEEIVTNSPIELIETPKIGRKLPEVLTIEEIDKIIAVI